MKDLTPQQHRELDRRVCQVLRQLQLYDERGAVDGAFASDAAVLSGFVRGEIREALHRMTAADQPAATETVDLPGSIIGDGSCCQANREGLTCDCSKSETARRPVGRNTWTLGTCAGCGGTNAALFDGSYCCKPCRKHHETETAPRETPAPSWGAPLNPPSAYPSRGRRHEAPLASRPDGDDDRDPEAAK